MLTTNIIATNTMIIYCHMHYILPTVFVIGIHDLQPPLLPGFNKWIAKPYSISKCPANITELISCKFNE